MYLLCSSQADFLDASSPQTSDRYCNYESFSIPAIPFLPFLFLYFRPIILVVSGIKSGSVVPVENVRPVSAGKTVAHVIFVLTSPSLEAATRRGRSVVYGSVSVRRW